MQTIYLELTPTRFLLTRLLGRLSRQAYFSAFSPVRYAEIPDPPLPSPNWVRVRNRMCGICGSDLHQIFLDADLDVAPAALPSHRRSYLGHEMVGEIVEVGDAIDGFAVGDRVVRWGRADDCIARGRKELCQACARGHRVLCEFASEPMEHEPIGGGYGDSFITPASTLLHVPDAISDEQAIFAEPAAVAIHAVWRRMPNPGERILVLGSGTIGFLVMQTICALCPTCNVSAMAQFPWQAQMAREFGAENVIMAGLDAYARVAEITGARLYRGFEGNAMLLGGFDAVWDVVGTSQTLTDALRWTKTGGSVVLVGVNLHRMNVDLTPVWYQEVDLIGAIGHGMVDWEDEHIPTFELAMRWMADGTLNVKPLLTHTFPLEEYRKAFATAADKRRTRSVKVAFDMRDRGGRKKMSA